MTSTIDQESARPPSARERALFDLLLEGEFFEAEHLRAQLRDCLVASNSKCGCSSLSIYPAAGAPGSGARDSDCPTLWQDSDAMEVALLISEGRAVGLEITHYSDGPARFPELSELCREPPRTQH